MKLRLFMTFLLAIAFPLAVTAKAPGPMVVLPDATKWVAITSGPMAGTEMAILSGDPAKKGPYIMRVRAKDGTKFDMHYHVERENVTVISGTMLVGFGDSAADKMTTLPPGAFLSLPPSLHHHAMTKGETVIQIDAIGPRTMVPVKMKKM